MNLGVLSAELICAQRSFTVDIQYYDVFEHWIVHRKNYENVASFLPHVITLWSWNYSVKFWRHILAIYFLWELSFGEAILPNSFIFEDDCFSKTMDIKQFWNTKTNLK